MRPYRVKPYTVPPWIHRALLSLRPAERLPGSKWAEKWRVLPDTNAIPGPFRNSVTPYLAEIMDAFSNEDVERIVFVKPTRWEAPRPWRTCWPARLTRTRRRP